MISAMEKKVTIRDVAKASGMSVATVSGVLNGKNGHAQNTVAKVWEIANRMNYIPSSSARTLQRGNDLSRQKTRIIMFMVHLGRPVPNHTRNIESAVLRMAWEAQKRNLFIIPYLYHDLAQFQCPPLLNGYVDGAILMTPHPSVVEIVSAKVPTVLIDAPFSMEYTNQPMVNVDWKYGARLFLEELKKAGHKKVSYIRSNLEPDRFSMSNVTLPALRHAAAELDFPLDEEYSFQADFNYENNIELLKEYLPKLKEGVRKGEMTALYAPEVCFLEMLQTLLPQENISCPGDLTMGAPRILETPSEIICTIYMDRLQLMTVALEKLLNTLEGRNEPAAETLLRPVLLKNQTFSDIQINKRKG